MEFNFSNPEINKLIQEMYESAIQQFKIYENPQVHTIYSAAWFLIGMSNGLLVGGFVSESEHIEFSNIIDKFISSTFKLISSEPVSEYLS